MKKITGVFIFLCLLLFFVIAAVVGFMFGRINKQNDLSSTVISSIMASGQVAAVNSQNITLTSGPDRLTFSVQSSTPVSAFSSQQINFMIHSTNIKSISQELQRKISDIKVGDTLVVLLRILPDGSLQAKSITISTAMPKK